MRDMNEIRPSEYSAAIVRHMMFTLFLILHENEEKYRSFRRNVQDNVFAVGNDDDDGSSFSKSSRMRRVLLG